ncbi:metal-dependent hydrolase [Candidatus Woesearchaeota archaeon]|nr:metal-dependent hydrolase [Candidatus Woesearchaeota archaeon]
MLGRTHLAAAVFLAVLFFSIYSYDSITNVFLLFLFVIGSLFPDVDSARSILGRKIKIISFIFKHRGFFHSIFALVLFSLLLGLLFKPIAGIVFASGFTLHIVMDAITKEGIHILGFKIQGPIKVGSITEHVFYLVLLVASLIFMII